MIAASAEVTPAAADVAPPDRPHSPYAGFITRVIAFALDAALINLAGILVAAAVALVFSILPVSHDVKTATVAIGGVVFVLWSAGYFLVFWTTTGQTPGNRTMRIRVVRADGGLLKPRHALLRLIGIVVSLPLLWGYVPILVTDRRRGVPDVLAGTVVMSTQ